MSMSKKTRETWVWWYTAIIPDLEKGGTIRVWGQSQLQKQKQKLTTLTTNTHKELQNQLIEFWRLIPTQHIACSFSVTQQHEVPMKLSSTPINLPTYSEN